MVLVEDGSPDDAWEVCRELAARHDKVHLFRHPNGDNRGAGASRNLGMQKSSCEFIAFLDADDYYLPGRFSAAREILDAAPDCEGVYEAVGYHLENEVGLERWIGARRSPVEQLTTMSERVCPEDLWDALISGRCGYFHLDGLVLRRNVLQKSGYMADGLRLHQDTEFILRVAMTTKLSPGRLDEPVATVRVHDRNRISAPRSADQKYKDRMLMWMELYHWCKHGHLGEVQSRIMSQMVEETTSTGRMGDLSRRAFPRRALRLFQLLTWLGRHPGMVIEPHLWRSIKGLAKSKARSAKE